MSDMQGTKEPPKTKLEILKFVGPIGGAIFIIGGFVCSVSLISQALTVLCCMYTDPKELRSRGLGRILMLVSIFGTIMLVLTVLYLEYGQ
jgi:hypothetical protein